MTLSRDLYEIRSTYIFQKIYPPPGGGIMAGEKNERGRKKGGKEGKRERGKKKKAKKGKRERGKKKRGQTCKVR